MINLIKCPHCGAKIPNEYIGKGCPNCFGSLPKKYIGIGKKWFGVRCLKCKEIAFGVRLPDIRGCKGCGNEDRDEFINILSDDFKQK